MKSLKKSDKLWNNFYKEDCIIKSINPDVSLDIEDFYVNLQGVQIKKDEVKGSALNTNFNRRDNQLAGRRINLETVVPIRPEEIFSDYNKRVLIYGSPGTGKTTICKKIGYEFYVNGMWNTFFDDIIWIQLRNLKQYLKILEDENQDLVFRQKKLLARLFEMAEEPDDYWESLLNNENRNILFILDGWDEIQDLLKKLPVRNVIKKFYNYKSVLLTTRPFAFVNFDDFYQIYEVTGFNFLNIKKFIRGVLTKTQKLEKYDEIRKCIETTVVNDLATIPILLDMFLYCWEDVQSIEKFTMTKLYETLFCKLWTEYLHKMNDANAQIFKLRNLVENGKVREMNNALCGLARKWLETETLDFSTEDFGLKEDSWENINNLSFVNRTSVRKADKSKSTFEFVHLTFCEFFAAWYIVNCSEKDANEETLENFVKTKKYNPEYRVVLLFICGLLESKNVETSVGLESLENLFDYFESDPFDIFGHYHYPLLVSCMGECKLPSRRANEMFREILEYTEYSEHNIERLKKLPDELFDVLLEKGSNNIKFLLWSNLRSKLIIINGPRLKGLRKLCASINKILPHLIREESCEECEAIGDFFTKELNNLPLEQAFDKLPSSMKDHVIFELLDNPDTGKNNTGKYYNIDLSKEQIITFFKFSIGKKDFSRDIKRDIANLLADQNRFRRYICFSKFLKNTDDFEALIISRINEMLASEDLPEESYFEILELAFNFKTGDGGILKKLFKIAEEKSFGKRLVYKLLCKYHKKDIPNEESKYVIKLLKSVDDISELTKWIRKIYKGRNWSKDAEEAFIDFLLNKLLAILPYYDSAKDSFDVILDLLQVLQRKQLSEQKIQCILVQIKEIWVPDSGSDLSEAMPYELSREIKRLLLAHYHFESVKMFISENDFQFRLGSLLFLTECITENKQINKSMFKEAIPLFKIPSPDEYFKFLKVNAENSDIKAVLKQCQLYLNNQVRLPEIPWDVQKPLLQDILMDMNRDLNHSEQETHIARILKEIQSDDIFEQIPILFQGLRGTELSDFFSKLCAHIHDDELGYCIHRVFRDINWCTEREPIPLLLENITEKNYNQLITIFGVFSDFPFYIYEGIFHVGSYCSSDQTRFSKSVCNKIKLTKTSIDQCCRSIRLNEEKEYENLSFKADLKDLVKLKSRTECFTSLLEKMDLSSENWYEGLKNAWKNHNRSEMHEDECEMNIPPFDIIFATYLKTIDHVPYSNEHFRSLANVSEDNPKISFLHSPHHLNLSGTNLTDTDIFCIIDFIESVPVHTIILNDNRIMKTGFHFLLTSAVTNLKHLFVNRNYIYFKGSSLFQLLLDLFETQKMQTNGNCTLETLDISGNFISLPVFKETSEYETPKIRDKLEYLFIENCKLIYRRPIIEPFIAAVEVISSGLKLEAILDHFEKRITESIKNAVIENEFKSLWRKNETMQIINRSEILDSFKAQPNIDSLATLFEEVCGLVDEEYERDKIKVTEDFGCIAVAEKKTWHNYNGHHVIIIERVFRGQRIVQTAELFQGEGVRCKIQLKEVEPFQEYWALGLKSRMKDYNMRCAKFSNSDIDILLEKIENSKRLDVFLHYKLNENGMNCVQWVNDMMSPITGFDVNDKKIPLMVPILNLSFFQRLPAFNMKYISLCLCFSIVSVVAIRKCLKG